MKLAEVANPRTQKEMTSPETLALKYSMYSDDAIKELAAKGNWMAKQEQRKRQAKHSTTESLTESKMWQVDVKHPGSNKWSRETHSAVNRDTLTKTLKAKYGNDVFLKDAIPVDELDEAGDLVTTLQPGDTVWVRWNNFTTKTGTVKRIGRTMIHVTLKNGETVAFPPKDVSQDFEELNPNPYREKQGSLSEMTMHVDSFAEFRERCEHLGYVIKIEDGVAVAYDEHGAVVGKFTQDGRHGHGQLVVEHQPPTLINFLSQA